MTIDDDLWDRAIAAAWAGAVAAARDPAVAEQALVCAARSLGPTATPAVLRRRAVRVALGLGAPDPFMRLPVAERCAIGLARLAGADVEEIADEMACTRDEVRRLLRSGLLRLVHAQPGMAHPRTALTQAV
jgi:hypothetical protein